jgi:alpha-N-arabinofuranosidase
MCLDRLLATAKVIGCLALSIGLVWATDGRQPEHKRDPSLQATITIRPNSHIGTIDPHIYGHFPELVFRVFYGGLWAEMLRARKFETRDGEYGVVKPWYSIGRTEKTHFMHDNTVFYSGRQSQKIVSWESPGHEVGIGQKELFFEKGKVYQGRINVRQEGITTPLVIALDGQGGTHASNKLLLPEARWTRFSFNLTPTQRGRDGSFTVKFSGPGTLWIGTVSLMPEDHLSGYRKDVIEALRAIRMPNLRWPGGNFVSYYRWEDGIGDRDRRPSRLNLSRAIEREGIYFEPSDVGIDEFIELCRLTGGEPFVAVNAGDGTPEEAARLVEYCNGPTGSTYGCGPSATRFSATGRVAMSMKKLTPGGSSPSPKPCVLSIRVSNWSPPEGGTGNTLGGIKPSSKLPRDTSTTSRCTPTRRNIAGT